MRIECSELDRKSHHQRHSTMMMFHNHWKIFHVLHTMAKAGICICDSPIRRNLLLNDFGKKSF